MLVGDRVDRAHTGHDRDAEDLGKLDEGLVGSRGADAEAREDDRALCLFHAVENLLHGLVGDCGDLKRRILRRVVGAKVIGLDRAALDVERNVEPDRARAARFCQMESPLEMVADRLRILHRHGIFRDRLYDGDDVALLDAAASKRQARVADRGRNTGLARENHERLGAHEAAENARHGVGRAGSCRHADRRHAVRDTRVGFRSHGAGLLMVIVGACKARMMAEGVIHVHGKAAGHREDVGDPVVRREIRNVIRNFLFHSDISPLCFIVLPS